MMFKRLKLRLKDVATIKQLIHGADDQAHLLGEQEPGAEHFLLSALNLPDGTAGRVFQRIGASPEKFKQALKQQYLEALDSVGINAGEILYNDPEPAISERRLQHVKPSAQALMKALYALKQQDKNRPLLSAHVLSVVANTNRGVVARALKIMGIEKDKVLAAVKEELELFSA
jgi:ATP-dependent Clp protease ATP-binding subunit ClpA